MTMPLKGLGDRPVNLKDFNKPKSVFDPQSEFMKQLEIYKLKAETKPRKVDMLAAQNRFAEGCLEAEKTIRIVVPHNYTGGIK